VKRIFELFFVILAVGLILSSVCKNANQIPNKPEMPSGPSPVLVNVDYSFSSSAIDNDEDAVRIRFDWGDSDTSDWSELAGSGAIVFQSHSWSAVDTYFIHAQAKDSKDNLSDWSDSKMVIVVTNIPPNTPSTPIGEDTGYTNAPYSFYSKATDPSNDSIAIRFDWGDGTISNWSNFTKSGDSVFMNKAYSAHGSYLIKAQTKDINGDTSGWSNAHSIIIQSGTFIIMQENFEAGFPLNRWTLIGNPTWDTVSYRQYAGIYSCWCAGSNRHPWQGYVADMNAHMKYGPFSLVGADSAKLTFYVWSEIEDIWDGLYWGYSTNGTNFTTYGLTFGSYPYWRQMIMDLSAMLGQPQVWISFWFLSDDDVQFEGAYLDNIVLSKFHSGK